jgi:hypothetical protein
MRQRKKDMEQISKVEKTREKFPRTNCVSSSPPQEGYKVLFLSLY